MTLVSAEYVSSTDANVLRLVTTLSACALSAVPSNLQ